MTDDKVRPGRECACGEDRASMMVRHRRRLDGLSTVCRACNRARKAEYRAANPDYDRDYNAANRDKRLAANRDYYAANRDKRLAANRDYHAANRDRVLAAKRARLARLSARTDDEVAADRAAAHPAGVKQCRAGHAAPVGAFFTNRTNLDGLNDRCRPCDIARRAERRNGARLQWWAKHGVELRCLYCFDPYAHADHVVPLAGGGVDALWALRPACAACNGSKSDRPPLEWLASRPVLPYSDELAAVSWALTLYGELHEDAPVRWSTDWLETACQERPSCASRPDGVT